MKLAPRELPEFVRVERGRRVALVHPDFMPAAADALLEGKGLEAAELGGRGQLMQLRTPQGQVLLREYRRGGAIAKVLNNAYLLDNRAQRELEVHRRAWCAGVPTVLPVGARWARSGLVYRGAYATLRADAVDLLAYLETTPEPSPKVLAACGRAIRAMHESGIDHADLQVKNILVAGDTALLIDFDKARYVQNLSAIRRETNIARLKRSFVKRKLDPFGFETILKTYNAG